MALLNFCVNLLLLGGTVRLAGGAARWHRLVLAAALGAAFAAGCLAPGFSFLGQLHWRIVSLGLMSLLAFGMEPGLWKRGCIFALLTMALGGMALAVGQGGAWAAAACAAAVNLLGRFAFGTAGRRLLPVTISGGGKTVRLKALRDTGNGLRDPVTGQRVLVIGEEPAMQLTGLTAAQLRDPVKTLVSGCMPGLRLIPYRSVGMENGLLLAMRFPVVSIGGREGEGIVAFAPQSFGGGEYQALAGGNE